MAVSPFISLTVMSLLNILDIRSETDGNSTKVKETNILVKEKRKLSAPTFILSLFSTHLHYHLIPSGTSTYYIPSLYHF